MSGATSPVTVEKTLRRLFLALFLRGNSARGEGLKKKPPTIASRLGLGMLIYVFFGIFVTSLSNQPLFVISGYLHATTFIIVGMFIAGSAGETLFNKYESDILLHRPISAATLLWSKIAVLLQVSVLLALAFNLTGFVVGALAKGSSWLFVVAHLVSTLLEALFCTSIVVLTYQLCLRWFGREKLESLMTTMQVLVSISFVVGAQIVPRAMRRLDDNAFERIDEWWVALIPPAWFAGMDDAIAGSGSRASWILALCGITATAVLAWIAFRKLAATYLLGVQTITEGSSRPASRNRKRLLTRMVRVPPLSYWLRDSVIRSSFLLSAAYLLRDRDMKTRVYPGIAPMLVMPVLMLMPDSDSSGSRGADAFGAAFAGSFIGMIPMMVIDMLELSQHWQASDLFRLAPIAGPARIVTGARRAVMLLITLPMVIATAAIITLLGQFAQLPLMIPGLLALPLYAMFSCVGGRGIPLSRATEQAKSAMRGTTMIGVMLMSGALAGVATWSYRGGWLYWLIAAETVIVGAIYVLMKRRADRATWPPI